MNLTKPSPAISVVTLGSVDDMRERIRKKSQLKGRQADEASLREVRALIGAAPYRRDLLIEHLHRLNDTYRGLHERHLTALAKLMNLPLAEVLDVLKNKPTDKHVIVTGRNAKDELIEIADLVTEMEQVKHPFRSGVKAQAGIEF